MRLLLDTVTFLWLVVDDPRLSPVARKAVIHPDNQVLLSAVSAWEIAVKHRLGRLPLPEDPRQLVPRARAMHVIGALPFDEDSALQLAALPDLHRDPFDRMLVCQATVNGLSIVTPDEAVRQYPVRTIW